MAATRDPDTLAHPPAGERSAVPAWTMADAAAALVQGPMAGPPPRMAAAATALWTRALRFDATDPAWPDRDRFVVSARHGAPLLYALLHLTGHTGMDRAVLETHRQLDSAASGHPEFGHHPAIEATTGQPGQGFANAVGMALAERMLAARFGRSLVDHRTWVLADDDDLMAGVTQEAASIAGQLRLDKLTVLWEDPAQSGDALRRFAALGWATKDVDGRDPAQLGAALSLALRSKKPTLIACAVGVAGSLPDGGAPPDLGARWDAAGTRGTAARRAWLKRLNKHPLRADFERALGGRLPEGWQDAIGAVRSDLALSRPTLPTTDASLRSLAALTAAIPDLTGGTTDDPAASPANPIVSPGSYGARHVAFGARDHGMAACLTGMALHTGILPYGTAALVRSDAMRPALRLAAMMRQRVIHVFTDDGFGPGGDGPAHQPAEQLAALRAMPGLHVLRPADGVEAAECLELALRRTDGPSALVLSRQPVPAVRAEAAENRSARGGYVLMEADGPRQVTLLATGSEVAIAAEARRMLADSGLAAAVVSLPCWELFALQDDFYRQGVLGTAPRIGIEAACGFGWDRWLGDAGMFIGMDGFGASAPYEHLTRHFGITPEAITAAVRKRLLPN